MRVYKPLHLSGQYHSLQFAVQVDSKKTTAAMYKLVILPLLFAAVSAGYLGGYAAAPALAVAPAVHAAPVAFAAPAVVKAPVHVATSYANIHQISHSVPVPVAVAAPAVHAAPVAYAAPVAVAAHAVHAAPLAVAAAPVLKAAPLAYGGLHGIHG